MFLKIPTRQATEYWSSLKFLQSASVTRIIKWPIRMMASSGEDQKVRNRLGKEKSPYLLQHATNPVDWYPWCNEAFEKAKTENKVIFLSVGYSTCHWCHVMERESFESERVAQIMNEHFVNIKVDREERPDIDKVYMTFVQASTGSGGWPMSVWLTPDLKPIVGGTYFPPDDRYFGRPGFCTILENVAEQWKKNRTKVEEQGQRILSLLQESVVLKKTNLPSANCAQTCFEQISRGYDESMGGFSQSPKFPQPVNFNFLLRYYTLNKESEKGKRALEMVLHTLKMMARGGIHDHVAKGFHRYSTDGKWHVPHFEKMLYDQAQLAVSFLDAYQISGDILFANVARDIIEYVDRDLRHKSGGCYSAEDADSLPVPEAKEKKEGAFCVWTFAEVQQLLSDPAPQHPGIKLADVFCKHFNVKIDGNVNPYQDPHDELKGQNVLIELGSLEETANHFQLSLDELHDILDKCKESLYAARLLRPKPHLDDKMIAAWNGLALSAFSRASQVLKDQKYIDSTKKLAEFLFNHMYDKDKKQLLRCVYSGADDQVECTNPPIWGILDDYCCVIRGLIDAYEVTFDLQWLEWAHDLQEKQQELFWDREGSGGYFNCAQDEQNVVLHIKADQDGAEPSGNSLAVSNLIRLSSFYARPDFLEHAEKLLTVFGEHLAKAPIALPEMVVGLMCLVTPCKQVIICGTEREKIQPFLDCVNEKFNPFQTVILANEELQGSRLARQLTVLDEILKQKDDTVVAYVCEKNTCIPPVHTVEELSRILHGV